MERSKKSARNGWCNWRREPNLSPATSILWSSSLITMCCGTLSLHTIWRLTDLSSPILLPWSQDKRASDISSLGSEFKLANGHSSISQSIDWRRGYRGMDGWMDEWTQKLTRCFDDSFGSAASNEWCWSLHVYNYIVEGIRYEDHPVLFSTLIPVLLKLGFHLLNEVCIHLPTTLKMIFSVPNYSGLHIPSISFYNCCNFV